METKRAEVSDNQNDMEIVDFKKVTTIKALGKWTTILCTLVEGDVVKISEGFGKPIGGEEVEILSIFSHQNVAGGLMVRITKYENPISINWVESLVSRK